jgi:hypothetical protein
MKRSLLLLSLAAALCTPAPAIAQTLATWNQPVNVTAADGSLLKSGGCDLCPDAGAYSSTRIADAGYTEFVPASGFRLTAGLTAEGTPATDGLLVDYQFSIWPNGVFEIREKGVYRGEGSFAAGDRFRIALESGRVVYRRNGNPVYTSAALPVSPLALSVTLSSSGASVSEAVLYLGSDFVTGGSTTTTTTTTTTTSSTTWPSGVVSSGPYQAIIERQPHAKPALPAVGPAGSSFIDPVFLSTIHRITDGNTRPGYVNRSFRTPSSPHQNAWSAAGTYLYVTSGDGSILPYSFDASTGTAQRVQPSATGDGGLVLRFYIEPQFSHVTDTLIYGSMNGAGATFRTIDQYDFASGTYTRLLDLDALVGGLSGTYIGGVASSAGPVERVMAFFGGTSQDKHHYVVVFDKANPQNRLVLDTTGNTLNGQPISYPLSISLHHAAMDRSGRYVMLYSTWTDQSSTRKAAQSYLWDTQTGGITELNTAALPYGHDAFGYGVSVNQDCCVTTTWDAAQWQFRNLSTPLVTRDVITNVLTPKEIYLADHGTWNNARPDRLVPFISGLFRSPASTTEWRAWGDEIVAVQTDAAAGADATVWRFAHHRTDVRNDSDPSAISFWYEPRPNVSPDGRWVMFTSNWEKTLGTDPTGDATTHMRQDVFLVELKPAGTPAPPPPSVTPVAIATTSVPGGRERVAYAATLTASGGTGSVTWSVSSGALPSGLTLNASTGVLSGTPTLAGSYLFSITGADTADAADSATAAYTLTVDPGVKIVSSPALPGATVRVPYSFTVQGANVQGTAKWSKIGGSLPPGISLSSTGVVSGKSNKTGSWSFTARVDDANTSDAVTLTLVVSR